MLEGQNIICFAKDWSQDPTSNNHVMRLLARNNRVLWVNSIGMRKPNIASRSDIGKMLRAVRKFVIGPVEVEKNLWVFTPLVLPLPHSRWATSINQRILLLTIAFLRRRLKIDRFQLWTFLPNVAPYVGKLGESSVVYYCTDDFSHFTFVDGARLAAAEEQLCRKADVVFTTARPLLEKHRARNRETHLALHGVDHAHFSTALGPLRAPQDLADVRGPVLGFFGWIQDWIDLDLIAYLAGKRPDWTIALIGKSSVDISHLQRFANVRILGQKPYADLPKYCRVFSVGLVPFVINELTRSVNPIKLREYLSAGLPVVATDLPEIRAYNTWCEIAQSRDEFLEACERAISADSPDRRRKRSDAMAAETWEARVAEIGRIVSEVIDRRSEAA